MNGHAENSGWRHEVWRSGGRGRREPCYVNLAALSSSALIRCLLWAAAALPVFLDQLADTSGTSRGAVAVGVHFDVRALAPGNAGDAQPVLGLHLDALAGELVPGEKLRALEGKGLARTHVPVRAHNMASSGHERHWRGRRRCTVRQLPQKDRRCSPAQRSETRRETGPRACHLRERRWSNR